jgi:hypothetical protein
MKFTYYDNSKHPSVIVAEINAVGIVEADQLFEQQTGLKPVKSPWIGCSIEKEEFPVENN